MQTWPDKFRSAGRGVWLAFRGERSFAVHLPLAASVAIFAGLVRVSLVEACLLALCATLVLVAETFNTAVEALSREISRESRPGIGVALDMASGAVLLASLGAAGVGLAIFVHRCGIDLGWWA